MALNSFLKQAKQASPLETVLAERSPSEKRRFYKSAITSFGKFGYSQQKFDQFRSTVDTYIGTTGLNTAIADYDTFKKALKQGANIVFYSDFLQKKQTSVLGNRKLTDREIRRAYVAYWTDRMITEHNERITRARDLYKKHYDKDFVASELQPFKPGTHKTIGFSELVSKIETFEPKLVVRAAKSTYKKPSKKQWAKYDDDIRSTKKLSLSSFGNTDMLLSHNLYRILTKLQWDSALYYYNQLFELGRYDDILKAYEESGVDFKYNYKEEQVDNDEQKLVRALSKYYLMK